MDFSDDDSVADPWYVPDPEIDERTMSDLFDFCEEVLNSDENSSSGLDIEHFIHRKTQNIAETQTSEIPKQSEEPIFIAKYPEPIYIASNVAISKTLDNKNMLKHPMIRESCDGKCRRQCSSFSYQERQIIWDEYWKMNFPARRGFLNKFVQISEVKRRRVEADTSAAQAQSKNETRHYYLAKNDIKDLIPVCRRFFLDTLGLRNDAVITELSRAVKKGLLYASLAGEKRGGHRMKLDRQCIQEHILSYKPVVTHYRRHN